MDPAPASSPLLERRLIVVSGKGGAGKTTLTATLALRAARGGQRVMVVETGETTQIPELLRPGHPEVGYEGAEVLPGLHVMHADPFAALAEYLETRIGMRALVDRIIGFEGFRELMRAAPGWRELITLGKVWHLEQMQDAGSPRYDLILVDAPATGHGVRLLDVPRVAASALRGGPLREHTLQVEALIADAERTLLLPIALAEELPVKETRELVERARSGLSIHVDRVVLNAVEPAPFPPGCEDLDERLAALPDDLEVLDLPPAATLTACARHLRRRHELNQHYAAELSGSVGLPTLRLPYLAGGIRGPESLEELSESLEDEPA